MQIMEEIMEKEKSAKTKKKEKCKIKNRIIAYKLKRYGNQVRRQNPQ